MSRLVFQSLEHSERPYLILYVNLYLFLRSAYTVFPISVKYKGYILNDLILLPLPALMLPFIQRILDA